MKPLGVAHFYHAFSVNQDCEDGPNFREAALYTPLTFQTQLSLKISK